MLMLFIIVHTLCFTGRLLNADGTSKELLMEHSTPTTFIADVIRSFNWTSVSILYDASSAPSVSKLLPVMTSKTPSCKIIDYNIDTTDLNSILKNLHLLMFPSINIVLLCKPGDVPGVLRLVNDYDSTSNRTTDYRHLSKWIVLADRRTMDNIPPLALNLENVLFVSPRSQLKKETDGVAVFTLQGTGTSGRLVPVTSYLMTEAFPNMKYGLNNRTLLVSTIKEIFYDVMMNVVKTMAHQLNFSIQFTGPADGAWGEYENGTWTGLIGQLHKREVDIVAAPLTISDDRAAVMDYLLPPFLTNSIRVMYREPDVDQYRWLLLLKPFNQTVFLVYGVCVLCVLLIYGVIELQQRRGTLGDTVHGKTDVMSNISWFLLGSLFKQGSSHTFKGVSAKVLTFFWWIFLLVVTSVYAAKLVAFLSVKTSEPPPFTNLQELSERLDYTIGFPVEGFFRTHFQISKRNDMKQIWKRVQQQNDPRSLSGDYDYHVSEMKKGKHAAIVATGISGAYLVKDCKLTYLKDRLQYDQSAFGLPTNSPLKPDFERVYVSLESPLYRESFQFGLASQLMQPYRAFSSRKALLPVLNCSLLPLLAWYVRRRPACFRYQISGDKRILMHLLVDTGLTDKWMQEAGWLADKRRCQTENRAAPATLVDLGGALAAVAACVGLALLTLAVECIYHLYPRIVE